MEVLMLIALFCFLTAIPLIYWWLHQWFSYWAIRGVIHDKPILFYGNLREVGRSKPFRQPFRDFYAKYKHQATFGGFFMFMRPAVILFDLDLVKSVMIRDFKNFADRGNYYNDRDDPLSGNLFNLDGPKWRKLRTKLTPTFTSGKMKFMLPTVVQVAQQFVEVLRSELGFETTPNSTSPLCIEIKDLLARFTTDVIGNCAFGLECNSLRDPQTQFRLMGSKVFADIRNRGVLFALKQAFPKVSRTLGLKVVSEDVHRFFMGVVRDTVDYRERTPQLKRNDFMNLLLELKVNNALEGLTVEEIAAQAFAFFTAGFESSSSTMAFCLYELAMNVKIQERARTEINEVLKRHNDALTYECTQEFKYLQHIVKETLRLYSIASIILRKTINDYPVPNTKHIIEKGTAVIIPVDAIHHDPDIYVEPEIFNPDRFTLTELEKRSSMTWLAFGEGPRNCIGLRFGEMQILVGLAMLLKHFRFHPAPQTPIPLEVDMNNFILSSKGGIILNVESIETVGI